MFPERLQNDMIETKRIKKNFSTKESQKNVSEKEGPRTPRYHSSYNEDLVRLNQYLALNIAASLKGDTKRFYCYICGKNDKSFKEPFWDYIVDHLESSRHVLYCPDEDGRMTALEVLKGRNKKGRPSKPKHAKDKVQRELRMLFVGFLLQNGLPFTFIEDLTSFCKSLFQTYDKQDLEELTLSKTTATKIAQSCIATSLKKTIFEDLEKEPYSLSVDESSDMFGDSYLAITAKYIKEENSSKSNQSYD